MNLMDLYNNGNLTAQQFAELTAAAKQLEATMGVTEAFAQETLTSLLDAYGAMNSFVDDEQEPTEEELAIHLSEIDAVEEALARLEDET